MHPLPSPPRTTRSTFGRDLALLLGIPGLLFVALLWWWQPWRGYEVPEATTIFDLVAGTWDWEHDEEWCEENPHTVAFSPDHTVMIITHAVPWTDSTGQEHQVAEYDIQQHSRQSIRGLIRGETRLTTDGEPVVWDLVLGSADSYRWHRTDWPPLSYTGTIWRCPEPEVGVPR